MICLMNERRVIITKYQLLTNLRKVLGMAAKVEKSFNIDKMPGRGTVVINGAPILLI